MLTTHRTALPEVGGDAVAYTEPDSESIRAALSALLRGPDRPGPRSRATPVMRGQWSSARAASAEAHMISYERAAAQAAE